MAALSRSLSITAVPRKVAAVKPKSVSYRSSPKSVCSLNEDGKLQQFSENSLHYAELSNLSITAVPRKVAALSWSLSVTAVPRKVAALSQSLSVTAVPRKVTAVESKPVSGCSSLKKQSQLPI